MIEVLTFSEPGVLYGIGHGCPPRIDRFGPFELSRDAAELRKSGIRPKLQDQPFQVLCTLLDHPGELVTREQRRQQLWPDGAFVDFEHGLNTAIKKLRDTLSDDADAPRYIETVPRKGYRFIASLSPAQKAVVDEKPLATSRRSRLWLPLIMLSIVTVAVAGYLLLRPLPIGSDGNHAVDLFG